jgi:tetratricopeptide (TPR) repeat protein
MTGSTVDDARALAHRMLQQGRAADAENILRQIVAQMPGDAESRHLLGVIYAQSARFAEAEQMIRSAIQLSPKVTAYYTNLGNVLQELGKNDQAIAAYASALAIAPSLAVARSNLGNALQKAGRFAEAIQNYREALRVAPDAAVIWVNLGNALRASSRNAEATGAYQRAVEIQPGYVDALLGLAAAQLASEQFGAVVDTCHRAIAIDASSNPARQMLGSALRTLGRPSEAAVQLREATRRDVNRWEAWHELGGALREAGDLAGSIGAYRHAIQLNPNDAGAHYGLAWSLLQGGDYAEGFAEYEWRERLELAPSRPAALPRWDGGPGKQQRVALIAEQGFGDCIMAYRYLPMVRERVGEVIVQCPAALQRFFAQQLGACCVVTDVESAGAMSYCPMMSLPRLFDTRVDTIPGKTPYLVADEARRSVWRGRIASDAMNIGIAWMGNATPRYRSISPDDLQSLNTLEGVRFHSLQGGPTARAINAACNTIPVIDWSAELIDFAEVAALIANLDCIVTIDTAVAHLAGAMGKRTLVLLNYAPDWRWFSDRADSPWYPTVKLFRQKQPLDWRSPLAEALAELRK